MDEEEVKNCLCGESDGMHVNLRGHCLSEGCECEEFEELNSQE